MGKFKNIPVHLDSGKTFVVNMVFKFEDWTDYREARESIEKYIFDNGIPMNCLSDVTSYEEYKRDDGSEDYRK